MPANRPNVCINTITLISPSIVDIAQMYIDRDGHLRCEEITPLPKDESEDEYWCKEQWGTSSLEQYYPADLLPGVIRFQLHSEWTPPILLMISLAEREPDLEISLVFTVEHGTCGAGSLSIKNGRVKIWTDAIYAEQNGDLFTGELPT